MNSSNVARDLMTVKVGNGPLQDTLLSVGYDFPISVTSKCCHFRHNSANTKVSLSVLRL